MKKLRIENDARTVYDIEHATKTLVMLKGVGRYCQNKGCNKHLFGKPSQKYCSDKCRWKANDQRPSISAKTLHANFNLQILGTSKNKYRIVRFYMKRGISEQVRITPESIELWAFLDKVQKMRENVIIV